MTKETFAQKLAAYISNVDFTEKIGRVIHSGCIDFESISEDDYTVIKAAAYAILKDVANDLKPLSNKGIIEANNISKFL